MMDFAGAIKLVPSSTGFGTLFMRNESEGFAGTTNKLGGWMSDDQIYQTLALAGHLKQKVLKARARACVLYCNKQQVPRKSFSG
jgi:hypothetical protein